MRRTAVRIEAIVQGDKDSEPKLSSRQFVGPWGCYQERMVKTKTILSVVLTIFCFVGMIEQSHSRSGHRKVDQVTLFNGDKLTGEIKTLYGGLLELSTSSLGTVKIEWQEIARVESPFHYEVRMSDGSRLYGSLDGESRPGEIALRDIYGEHLLNTLEVVEVRPVERQFSDRLHAYLSAGYSYTRASGVASTTFNTDISYETEAGSTGLNGRTTITDTDEESTSSTRINLNRKIWTGRERWFRTFFTSYEDNDELNLDHRLSGGFGYGRYLMDTHKTRLMATAGLQATTERGTDQKEDEEQNLEIFLATTFATWRYETPELELDFGFTLFPSITETGRLRGDFNLRLSWELIRDLTWDITGWGTYDNKSDSTAEFDYGVTTGVGWKY